LRKAFDFGDLDGDKRLSFKEFAVAMQLVLGVAKRNKQMPLTRPEELTAYLTGQARPAGTASSSVPVFSPRSTSSSPTGNAGGMPPPAAAGGGVMNPGIGGRAAALSAAFDGLSGGDVDSPVEAGAPMGAPTPPVSAHGATPLATSGPAKPQAGSGAAVPPPVVTSTPQTTHMPPAQRTQPPQKNFQPPPSQMSAHPVLPSRDHSTARGPFWNGGASSASMPPCVAPPTSHDALAAQGEETLQASRGVNAAMEASLQRERVFGKRVGDAVESAKAELKQLQAERGMLESQTAALRNKAVKDNKEYTEVVEQITQARMALAAARSQNSAASISAQEAAAAVATQSGELAGLVAELARSTSDISNLSSGLAAKVQAAASKQSAAKQDSAKAGQLAGVASRHQAAAGAASTETAALRDALQRMNQSVAVLQSEHDAAEHAATAAGESAAAATAALVKARSDIVAARKAHDDAVHSKLSLTADVAEADALRAALQAAVHTLRALAQAGGPPAGATTPPPSTGQRTSVAITPAVAASMTTAAPLSIQGASSDMAPTGPVANGQSPVQGGTTTGVTSSPLPRLGSTGSLEKLSLKASQDGQAPAPMAPRGPPHHSGSPPSSTASPGSVTNNAPASNSMAMVMGRPPSNSIDHAFSGLDLGEEVSASPLPPLGGTPSPLPESGSASPPPTLSGGATPSTSAELPLSAATESSPAPVAGALDSPPPASGSGGVASPAQPIVSDADFDFDESDFSDAAFEEAAGAVDAPGTSEEVAMPPAPDAPVAPVPDAPTPPSDGGAGGGAAAEGGEGTAGEDAFGDDSFGEDTFAGGEDGDAFGGGVSDDAFGDGAAGVSGEGDAPSPPVEGGRVGGDDTLDDPFGGEDAAFDAFGDGEAAFDAAPAAAAGQTAADEDDAFAAGEDDFGDDPFA
jgi:hypothetical protein